MREELRRVVKVLADLDNTKQLSPEQTEEFVDFIVGSVIVKVLQKIQNVEENFDFSIYDHPYFSNVPTMVVGEDLLTLLRDEIESLNG